MSLNSKYLEEAYKRGITHADMKISIAPHTSHIISTDNSSMYDYADIILKARERILKGKKL